MRELKIGDTAIASIRDEVAAELVKAAQAKGEPGQARVSTVALERTAQGSCRLSVPLDLVIEYWPAAGRKT